MGLANLALPTVVNFPLALNLLCCLDRLADSRGASEPITDEVEQATDDRGAGKARFRHDGFGCQDDCTIVTIHFATFAVGKQVKDTGRFAAALRFHGDNRTEFLTLFRFALSLRSSARPSPPTPRNSEGQP